MEILRNVNVSFISTYPPMKCGVGVFTSELVSALLKGKPPVNSKNAGIQVVAVSDEVRDYSYDKSVAFEVKKQNFKDYLKAADFLNNSLSEVICLQHEYGMYGGKNGKYLLSLLRNLKKPVVTTLHTIQEKPTVKRKEILKKVCEFSKVVVVMSETGKELLSKIYDVFPEKVKIIPHGAPDVPFSDGAFLKKQLNGEGRPIIFTFGLIRPSKGLEVAIEAMVKVVKEIPEVLYIVLGATHPSFKGKHGESYRVILERLVREKGLEENVIFRNEFVSNVELIKYLRGVDICLTPYLSRDQISSGVLSYALVCGKAIVSTPYLYALELLKDGIGALVPFEDPVALARILIEIIKDEQRREKMKKAAYDTGRAMIWERVADSYAETFSLVIS
jgi:glycosyltransferase involved in cell wall biosynthesis